MKAKKQKIKNLIKAGAISLPLILSNPIQSKAQDYIPKYNTIGHKVMKIQGQADSIKFTYKTLDNFLDKVNKNIEFKNNYTEKEAKNILKKLDSFSIMDETQPEEGCFEEVCFYLSAKDLAKQKGKKFPIYAVPMKTDKSRHLFIRYDTNGIHNYLNPKDPINKGDFNYSEGANIFFTDSAHKQWIKNGRIKVEMTEKSIREKAYMHNFSKKEILSLAYAHKSRFLIHKGKEFKAIDTAKKAYELNTNGPYVLETLGLANESIGAFDSAAKYYKKAYELNTKEKRLGYAVGRCYWMGGKWEKSDEYIEMVDKKSEK